MKTLVCKTQLIRFAAAVTDASLPSGCSERNRIAGPESNYADPNDYTGSDSERINTAIREAGKHDGYVMIGKRKADEVSDRDYWLLDSAILIPGNTTLVISNCRIKLSDCARDNWIRSANCVVGKPDVDWISNVHIIGEGTAVLEGADDPRATGDGAKNLTTDVFDQMKVVNGKVIRNTYGTDAGKAGESQTGDWRNIGILLARVKNFSIRNLTLRNAHCWSVSLEYCRQGQIRELNFEADEYPVINGRKVTMLNRDGLDLRNGCRDITIENITGYSGDDLIALTAIGSAPRPAGKISGMTHFCGADPDLREQDVFNIVIRNIRGYSAGGYMIVRFLNQKGVRMHHIQLDGLLDASPAGHHCRAAVKIGDANYGGPAKRGETSNFLIGNIQTQAKHAFIFGSPLCDSMISNVMHFRPDKQFALIGWHQGKQELPGVMFNSCRTVDPAE